MASKRKIKTDPMKGIDIGINIKKDKEYRIGYVVGFLHSVAQRHKIEDVKRLLVQQPNLIQLLKENGQSEEAIAKFFRLELSSYLMMLAEITESKT